MQLELPQKAGLQKAGWWLLCVALIPLIPVGTAAIQDGRTWMERSTGAGQLLFTGFGLIAGMYKEMHEMPDGLRKGLRKFVFFSSLFTAAIALIFYGVVTEEAGRGGVSPERQHEVAQFSIKLFCLCALISAVGVLVATPPSTTSGVPGKGATR